ncbi:guanine nucleotide-binding protein alpha-2 subunit [Penicillium nucicola]|uniref:guanine nucleotide-binding protein alpha-2 subunit n=1 Tax=Penicillium nucicola TaxID=1850975 RepID=UPI0025452EB9|nr:guanine nucleotide-binding protein alpha-2 subunit [Penicillium nucicola]KAJ5775827.1 guanine nucleotide-binding protein alpha-2 subunit [Penicillium nucicola]
MRIISSDGNSEHSLQDILRIHGQSGGATEILFTQANLNWRIVDLGGQSLERRKWMPCFGDVDYLIFVVPLSSYDQSLDDGHCTQNEMRDAMKLFDSFANGDYFKSKPILLVLDKLDIFEEKLRHSPIYGHFPEFNDSDTTLWGAVEYFGGLFKQINKTQGRDIYVHYTNTTDTASLKSMMALMYQMVWAQKLRSHGILDD